MKAYRRTVLVALFLIATFAFGPGRADSATIAVINVPLFVHLTTRPALPNATVSLDGVSYTTGADGTVTIPTSALNNLDQRLTFVSVVTDPLTHADFVRFETPPQSGNTREAIAVFNVPLFVHLTTRPALPNATVSLDGVPYTTGADGTVTIPTTALNNLDQRLTFVSVVTDPLTQADFVRFEAPPQSGNTREAIAVFTIPRFLQLTTIPPLPNTTFSLDGVPYTTGADGTVTISTSALNNLDQRLKFVSAATDPLTKADFVRLATPPQTRYWRQAVAIFDMSHAVRFSFADSSGAPVPLDRVTSMTIKSSTGEERRLSSDDLAHPVMLPAVHPYTKGDHPEPQILRYTVQDVIVDGSNTVIPSQHEFFPANVDDLHLDTSVFTVQVSVRDALFGFADASTVVVRHPDGTETRHAASGGKLTLRGLPRGDYEMRVEGAAIKSWRPISVSRDQTVELSPVSRIDLGAVAGVIVILFGGLLVVGNRRRARRRRRLGPPGEDPTGTGGSSPGTPEPGMQLEAPSREPEPVG